MKRIFLIIFREKYHLNNKTLCGVYEIMKLRIDTANDKESKKQKNKMQFVIRTMLKKRNNLACSKRNRITA